MNESMLPPPLPPRNSSTGAMAITSFVLGIIALITGLFVIGGVVGLIGLVLGIIHLKKGGAHRAFAGLGIGLSSIGLALAVTVLIFIWVFIRPVFQDMGLMADSFKPSEWIGKPVPEMTLISLDGRTIRTSDLKGRAVVLDMWASWHPSCIAAVPDFNRLVAEVSKRDLQVLAITFENVADLGEFTTNSTFSYPLIATTNLPAPFGKVDSVPTTFFINANGIIRDIRVGYEGYDALKQSALDQTPPTVVEEALAEEEKENP